MTARSLHLLVVALTFAGCECGGFGKSEDDREVVAWAELSYCLTGGEEPTPELIRRILMSADFEDLDDIPDPHAPAAEMGREPMPARLSKRWPRRCRGHARDLEHAVRDMAEEHLAHRVAEALWEGEIDPALYSLTEATAEWPSPTVSGVTPPPPPASPLPRADARPLLADSGCVPTAVRGDTTTTPMRLVAYVPCDGGARHRCTFAGATLDDVQCETIEEIPNVWALHEARIDDWTAGFRRDDAGCHYVVNDEIVGDIDCHEGDRFWARPCRAGDFAAVALIAPDDRALAMRDTSGASILEAPVTPDGGVTLSCTPEALYMHRTSSTFEFLQDEMEPGMIRPPTRSFLEVKVERCVTTGCESTEGRVVQHGTFARAARLGDEVITAELVNRDEGDGMLVHVAPLEDLGSSPPRWIIHPSDGIHLHESRFEWVVGAETAILLVADQEAGILAIRFDAEGEASFVSS